MRPRGRLFLLGLPLLIGGCIRPERWFSDEGRVLLQVHDAASLSTLPDVRILVLNHEREVARGATNAIGAVGLQFRAAAAAPTSLRAESAWVVLRLERDGYAPLELPLQRQDFVVLDDLLLLTRGIGMRRAL